MASATTSNYLFQKQMDFLLKGTAYQAPTTLYLALFTNGSPSLDGTGGTEVAINASTNYARVPIAQGSSAWSAPSGVNLEYSNLQEIVFNVPGTASWGTITSVGLYDSPTGGNLMWVGNIGTSKSVSSGDGAPRVLIGQLKISRAVC